MEQKKDDGQAPKEIPVRKDPDNTQPIKDPVTPTSDEPTDEINN